MGLLLELSCSFVCVMHYASVYTLSRRCYTLAATFFSSSNLFTNQGIRSEVHGWVVLGVVDLEDVI
jgi:hypothetical protein